MKITCTSVDVSPFKAGFNRTIELDIFDPEGFDQPEVYDLIDVDEFVKYHNLILADED